VGLADRLANRPNQLSGGQQQRVAIARALVNQPELLLADEPTGALDSRTGGEVIELISELHASGLTIVLVTHDPSVAQNSGRIIQLQDGRIIADQPRQVGQGSSTPARKGCSFVAATLLSIAARRPSRL
jgi:putative ABC transport system ATP-binding protein